MHNIKLSIIIPCYNTEIKTLKRCLDSLSFLPDITPCEIIVVDDGSTKTDIIGYLKEHNRGYTVFDGQGSVDPMNMLLIVLPRREMKKSLREIRALCDNKVFVVVSEVSKYAGGYGMVK